MPGAVRAPLKPAVWLYAAFGVLAALTRFVLLNYPTDQGTPVFDEKHYVPQGWQVLRSWDGLFVGGIEDNPAYGLVVHPPIGKQIIALSEWIFGYTPFGWRAASAACGVGVVLTVMAIARQLSRSNLVAACAGLIALCDGVLTVTSRSAMLDIQQCFFLTLAGYCVIRDAFQADVRIQEVKGRLGYRWWRFGAGVCLGVATGIKWNGLVFMAAFGVLMFGLDCARRRCLLKALRWDLAPALWAMVVVPVGIYLYSWRAWFASENSVFRHAAEQGLIAPGSWLHRLPDSVASWLYYQQNVLSFHSSLTNSNGYHHPWESKPWAWLVSARPILYYDSTSSSGHYAQLLLGTPAVWWLTVPVLGYGLYRWIVGREARWSFMWAAFAAGFVPWLVDFDRQMYFFYAANFVPWIIVGLAMILGQISTYSLALSPRGGVVDGMLLPVRMVATGRQAYTGRWRLARYLSYAWREQTGMVLVVAYLALVVGMWIYFAPLFYALKVGPGLWTAYHWLPSWG